MWPSGMGTKTTGFEAEIDRFERMTPPGFYIGLARNEQPIETAPRDGTEIEVLDEDGWQPAVWSENPCCILGSRAGIYPAGWATGPACDTDLNLPLSITPTHWRPL